MGDDITEVLDRQFLAELYVKRYVRRKYARPNGEGVVVGELPGRVIEKGIPSNRLVGEMMLDKYVYGLPLHRQIDKYRRLGVNIPASTRFGLDDQRVETLSSSLGATQTASG